VLLLGLFLPGRIAAQAHPFTLDEALASARAMSPQLRLAEADLALARADHRAAGLSAYNPEATFSLGPSTNTDTTLTSYQVGLSQTLELGGKRGLRGASAARRVEAAEARLARTRAILEATVRREFWLAILARDRLATALEADSVANILREAAAERMRFGAGTRLEVNVAAAASAQSHRTRLVALRDLRSAVLRLGAAIGFPASDTPNPTGILPRADLPTLPEDELVRLGLGQRADLAAAQADRRAAETEVRLSRALAWPDPTLGVSAGKAEDFRVLEFSVAVPLPLWNRGQGTRAQAGATLERARLAEGIAIRDAEREIRDAYRGLVTAVEAERAFDRDVVERLGENLALAEESFRAGKIGLLAFNTVRRELVEARLAYLDAVAEGIERRAALEQALGTVFATNE